MTPFWLAPVSSTIIMDAEWNTLPLTSSDLESSLFPYPAFKQVMETPSAIDATVRKIANTLSSGHELWIVGDMEFSAAQYEAESARTGARPHVWLEQLFLQRSIHASGRLLYSPSCAKREARPRQRSRVRQPVRECPTAAHRGVAYTLECRT